MHAPDDEEEVRGAHYRILAAPHPCLALSHVASFLKIGRAAAAGGRRRVTLLLSAADADALPAHWTDGVEVLAYPGAYDRAACRDLAARYADVSPLGAAALYVDVGVRSCEALLAYRPVWDALQNAAPPYDAVLGEPTWPCSSLVADVLERERSSREGDAARRSLARLFYQGNAALDPWCERWGVPSPATEVPQLMGTARFFLGPRDAPLPFWKRLLNTVVREVSRLVANRMMLRPYAALRREAGIAPVGAAPEAGIVLLPVVWGFEPPRALPPHWKPVYPVLPSPARALSGEVGSFVDGPACAGDRSLVVVAFGTQGFLSTAQAEKVGAALSALSSDFCVAWHLPKATRALLGPDGLASLGEHVLAAEWIPQNDLLGHPRTAAFVSHVGYGSLYEAAYHGVPLVALPLFGDQDDNAARAVLGGWGVRLDKDRFAADELADAVRRAGGERGPSSMRSKARAVSRLVKAGSGVDDVLEWMDYAYIHGTDHLVPLRAMKSSYIACYNLDVGVALGLSFAIAAYLGCSLMKKAGGRGRQQSSIKGKAKDM